jgi:DNA-binding response OmpR family regulator
MSDDLDPARHRVLLVGPRVVPLKAMFERRGYPLVAAANGVEGMAQLDTDPCDLVVLELNLGDLTATEFLMAARQGSPRATFLLVDEPARAGQIVKALQAGLDGFLAAPADEDRLFYEVERHLRRVGAAVGDASGFEEHSTQTQMTTVEATRAGVELRDLQAQLEQAREGLATLAAENERLSAEVRRFDAVQGVLAGQLEGRLDVDEATRLRERLGLAQVAEIELTTLRSDVQSLKASKRDQEQRIEELQRELRQARAAAEDARGFAEPPPTEVGRLGELEGRVRWRAGSAGPASSRPPSLRPSRPSPSLRKRERRRSSRCGPPPAPSWTPSSRRRPASRSSSGCCRPRSIASAVC